MKISVQIEDNYGVKLFLKRKISKIVNLLFEIDEIKKSENFVPSIFFIIAALILLIVGYVRKDENFRNN